MWGRRPENFLLTPYLDCKASSWSLQGGRGLRLGSRARAREQMLERTLSLKGHPPQRAPEAYANSRVRKISPKISCLKFFHIRDVPTQIPGRPGHSLSKTTEKGHLHKVFVRDIPTSGSRMSQEYPAQKLYV